MRTERTIAGKHRQHYYPPTKVRITALESDDLERRVDEFIEELQRRKHGKGAEVPASETIQVKEDDIARETGERTAV